MLHALAAPLARLRARVLRSAGSGAERRRSAGTVSYYASPHMVVFPKEVWLRVCSFLDVRSVLTLSECSTFLHGVATSQLVWRSLFADYFEQTDDRPAGDGSPFARATRYAPSDWNAQAAERCEACMLALDDGTKNPNTDAAWRLECGCVVVVVVFVR